MTGSADTDIRAEARAENDVLKEWGEKAKKDLSLYGLTSVDKMVAESVSQNIFGNPGTLAQQIILILIG